MLGLVASKLGNKRSLPKALGTCLINRTDSFNSSLNFFHFYFAGYYTSIRIVGLLRHSTSGSAWSRSLRPPIILAYWLGFVLEATASASLGFAIAHHWYMGSLYVVVGLLVAFGMPLYFSMV